MSYAGTPVLNKIDLSIPRGRIIGLLGPNGSGKTTLMKLCNGLLQPVSGSITIGGWPVGVETKKIVSFLPERTYFMPWMRVKNLVKMFRDFYEEMTRETFSPDQQKYLEAVLEEMAREEREEV